MALKTRDKFVATASQLLQQKGFGATSVGEIAKAGELPIGSLYYYFPNGKEELAAAAVALGAESFEAVLSETLATESDPGAAIAACARVLADRLEASDWRDGCPVATVALETVHSSERLQTSAQLALDSWVAVIASRLTELGLDNEAASEIATVTIAVLEGAELMARVAKSREPLDAAARRLPLLIGTWS